MTKITTRLLALLFAIFATSAAWATVPELMYYISCDQIGNEGIALANEAGSGTTTPTNWKSVDGNRNYAEGKFGYSAHLNAKTIGLINNSDSGLGVNTEEGFTISFWAKLNSGFGAWADFLSFRVGSQTYNLEKQGSTAFAMYYPVANTGGKFSDQSYTADEWMHYALVFCANNGGLEVYQNGTKVQTLSAAADLQGALKQVGMGPGRSGNEENSALRTCNSINGYIDDFAIFKGALTASQVGEIAVGTAAIPSVMLAPPANVGFFNGFSSAIETSGNYTLGLNGNEVESGAIKLGEKGINFSSSSGMPYHNSGYTVALKYSSLPTVAGPLVSTSLSSGWGNGSDIGLWNTSGNTANGVWLQGEWSGNASNTPTKGSIPTSGSVFLSLGYSETYKASAYTASGVAIYQSSGLYSSTAGVTGGDQIAIGAKYSSGNYNTSVLTGLSVEGLAVFSKRLSPAYIAAFCSSAYSANIGADTSWSAIKNANFNGDFLPTTKTVAEITLNVIDDMTLTVDSAVSVSKVTFNILSGKTLTLTGSTITAPGGIKVTGGGTLQASATISSCVDIDTDATVIANSGETIYVSNFKGSGTIVFDGVRPCTSENDAVATSASSAGWSGILWVKTVNWEGYDTSVELFPQYWGNSSSKIKWTKVRGYVNNGADLKSGWILEDGPNSGDYAFIRYNGSSNNTLTKIPSISGSGTWYDNHTAAQLWCVKDISNWTGKIRYNTGAGMGMALNTDSVSPTAKTVDIVGDCTCKVAIYGNSEVAVRVVSGTVTLNGASEFEGDFTVKSGAKAIAGIVGGNSANSIWYGSFGKICNHSSVGSTTRRVVVESGATIDMNGKQDQRYYFKLAGDGVDGKGALVNNGSNVGNDKADVNGIELSADASIGGSGNFGIIGGGYNGTYLDFNGYRLTKKGSCLVHLVNASIVDAGSLEIENGTIQTYNKPSVLTGLDVSFSGGKLDVSGANLTVGSITGEGTLSISSGKTLTATGTSATECALGTLTNAGTLNLSAWTSLTSFAAGPITNTGTITLPSSVTSLCFKAVTDRAYAATGISGMAADANIEVEVAELATDTGDIVFDAANINARTTGIKTFKLTHADGVEIVDATKTWGTGDDASKLTFSYVHTAGNTCVFDWEFNGDKVSTGTNTIELNADGFGTGNAIYTDGNVFKDGKMLYTYSHPYCGPSYGAAWSAAIRCTTPAYSNAVVVAFGTNNGAIGLIAGENDNQVKLVRINSSSEHYEEISAMSVNNATTALHLYVFKKYNEDVGEETEYSVVEVYCDGELIAVKKFNSTITVNNGLQIGAIHGGVASTGLIATRIDVSPLKDQSAEVKKAAVENSYIDFLRVYNSAISEAVISQMSHEYPYSSAAGTFTRTISSNSDWSAEDSWTKTDDSSLTSAPAKDSTVILKASANSEITNNLDTAISYGSLTLGGTAVGETGEIAVLNGLDAQKISAVSVKIDANTTVAYDAVDFSGSRLAVAEGKVLTYDFSGYDWESVSGSESTEIWLSGYVAGRTSDAYDSRIAVSATDKPVWVSTFTRSFDSTSSRYKLTMAPDHQAGASVYYTSGDWSSAGAFSVTNGSGGATIVFAGDTVVIPADCETVSASVSATLPDNITTVIVKRDFTFNSAVAADEIFDGVAISVDDGKTLTFGSSAKLGATVTSEGTVNIGVPAGTTLTLNGSIQATTINFTGGGTVVCSAADTLQGTITGSVTIEYPAGTLPVSDAVWTNAGWTGTNVFTQCGFLNTYVPGAVPFHLYGNENSFIKAPGFKGYSAVDLSSGAEVPYCQATLIIDAGEGNAFEFNHGTAAIIGNATKAGFKFKKLAGDGLLRLDGTSDIAQYIFEDVSGFTGDVEITDPNPDATEGGKKSFIFGLPAGWEVSTGFPANLVIGDGTVTVADGKTWNIPAGIVLNGDSTLTLGDGSTVYGISTISDYQSTLKVADGATATVTTLMKEKGVSTTVTEIPVKLDIGTSSVLDIYDPIGITTLTIPADTNPSTKTYSNGGKLALTNSTTLTTLHVKLGESKTFDLSKVLLPPSCTNIFLDIGAKRNLTGYVLPAVDAGTNIAWYATETVEEYANGVFAASNVVNGATLYLYRLSGATIIPTPSGDDRTYAGGKNFAGGACWHEWDFELEAARLGDTGMFSTNNVDEVALAKRVTLVTATTPAEYPTITLANGEEKKALSMTYQPYASSTEKLTDFPSPWATAVRCQMPSEANKVAIAFGDTADGMLGLASSEQPETVELFSWTNNVYTVLAQLRVESATNAMHIYVFSVTDNPAGTKQVEFYRDGEFIHSAEFKLNGNITQFKVGDVMGSRDAKDGLPAAANDGFVDYVRLYNKEIDELTAQALSARRPFVSGIETFEREAYSIANWSDTGAWTKKIAKTTADAPDANANVTLTANGSTMSLNLGSDVNYDTLIFNGSGENSLVQASAGKISANMLVVRRGMNLTVGYDAVCLTNSIVGVDQGASLKFNISSFPFAGVTAPTNVCLTGKIVAYAYDTTVASRVSIVGAPEGIWTVDAGIDDDPSSPTFLCYTMTVGYNHDAGDTIVWGDGDYWTGDSNNTARFWTEGAGNAETAYLSGDTVVINREDVYHNLGTISDGATLTFRNNGGTIQACYSDDIQSVFKNATVTITEGTTLRLDKKPETDHQPLITGGTVSGTGSLVVSEGGVLTLDGNATVSAPLTIQPNGLVVVSGSSVSSRITVDCSGVTFGSSESRRAVLTVRFALTMGNEGNLAVTYPSAGGWIAYVVQEDDKYVVYLAKPGTIFLVY